jgi:hypothetical protein
MTKYCVYWLLLIELYRGAACIQGNHGPKINNKNAPKQMG